MNHSLAKANKEMMFHNPSAKADGNEYESNNKFFITVDFSQRITRRIVF
jgi:hypothetical protein